MKDGKKEMMGGGMMRGYKFMEEGGETDPPKEKKYSFVQQAYIDNSLPTDEASLKELIETASKEKRQTVEVGDATGALMWTASEGGKEYDGLTGISEKGSAKAADYYDTLIAKAEEKLMSIKSKDDEESRILEPGEFEKNLGGELEKGRSFDDVNETMKGERGYKFDKGGKTPPAAYVSSTDRATALKELNDKLRSEGFASGASDPRAPKFNLYQDKSGMYKYRKV